MNKKYIGLTIIIIGIILIVLNQTAKATQDELINVIIESQDGSCYINDGQTCLHGDRDYTQYIVGWVVSVALIILGLYLIFFDKTQELLLKQNLEVSNALKEAKQHSEKKEKFEAFLAGFNEDEQKTLKAIHDQDGIQQSTLRYKTGISKSSLSLLLKNLEEREIISRKPEGKTNKVFLRKKF